MSGSEEEPEPAGDGAAEDAGLVVCERAGQGAIGALAAVLVTLLGGALAVGFLTAVLAFELPDPTEWAPASAEAPAGAGAEQGVIR